MWEYVFSTHNVVSLTFTLEKIRYISFFSGSFSTDVMNGVPLLINWLLNEQDKEGICLEKQNKKDIDVLTGMDRSLSYVPFSQNLN